MMRELRRRRVFLAVGIFFDNGRWGSSLLYRWVDDFLWTSCVLVGDVESNGTADFNANVRINDNTRIGLEAAIVFDSEHYELFGGDLLQRRVMAYIS